MGNTNLHDFVSFQSIPRLSRDIIISEKIDGTNSVIVITEDGEFLTGSRNRWITPEDDNYGFSKWAHEHKEELMKLGVGRHFGEWWGAGIQRRYNIGEKRFSLFNVNRWATAIDRPSCCHVVPVLYTGPFDTVEIDKVLASLKLLGSVAAPLFMDPEGIVIYHTKSGHIYKKTLGGDGHKSECLPK